MTEVLIIYLVAGSVVGVLSGIFGIGGGMVVVPTMLFTMPLIGMEGDHQAHLAIGTSHATIIFTAMASARTYHKKGDVDWKIFSNIAPGLIIGSFIFGAFISSMFSSDILKKMFAIFSVIMAIKIFMSAHKEHKEAIHHRVTLLGVGLVIGSISALIGVGGSSMTVPFLSWKALDIRKAVGTAAACGSLIAIFSTSGYIYSGLSDNSLPEYSLGYIFLPAFIGIIFTSTIFVRFGAKLAYKIPPAWQKRSFGVFLLMVAAKMWF